MIVSLKRFNRLKKAFNEAVKKLFDTMLAHSMLREALTEIIAQKTDKPNATVARIIKIAEEAVEQYGSAGKN
jgi:hypothetical protein